MNRKWHEVAEMSENGLKSAEMPYNDQNITEMAENGRKWSENGRLKWSAMS